MSLVHATASLLAALAVSVIIFVCLVSAPLRTIAGGPNLFLFIVSVDVVPGLPSPRSLPNPAKPPHDFRRDVMVIAAVQIAALGYGVYVDVARLDR